MDGTIRPRFGVRTVTSSCVCTRHFHHACCRFDFEIRTADGGCVCEYNDPPLFTAQNGNLLHYEIQRPRDPPRQRQWRVENIRTGEGCEIIPPPYDGACPTGRSAGVTSWSVTGAHIDDGPGTQRPARTRTLSGRR